MSGVVERGSGRDEQEDRGVESARCVAFGKSSCHTASAILRSRFFGQALGIIRTGENYPRSYILLR